MPPGETFWAKMHDSPLRWLIRSGSKAGDWHMVDLADNDGRGGCSCEDFTFRILPYLKKGQEPPGGRVRCRHITMARDKLVQVVINKMEQGKWHGR